MFFPLGLVLTWAGVGQWLLFSSGRIEQYLSIFHSMAQVQGFLVCFAMGFLLTMLPRRTESSPAGVPTLTVCAACPVVTVVAAGLERWVLAQMAWLVLLCTLATFVMPRLRRGGRRPPLAFLWIPFALVFGIGGSVLAGFGAVVSDYWLLHEIGQRLVLQGFFLCLVIGVGGFVLPLFTRGEGLPDAPAIGEAREIAMAHVVAATALFGSFLLEAVSPRWGHGLRAAVLWTMLFAVARIHVLPTRRGFIQWLVWLAAWCVPVGYTLSFALPILGKGALHVTFIGGFGLLAFSVSSQVVLGHGGFVELRDGRPLPSLLIGACLLLAVVARIAMELRSDSLLLWMTWSAGSFILATAIWAAFLLPRLGAKARA